jgi:hypothetical protein
MMEITAPAGAESPGRKDWMVGAIGVGVGGDWVGVEGCVVPQAATTTNKRLKPIPFTFLFMEHLLVQTMLFPIDIPYEGVSYFSLKHAHIIQPKTDALKGK